MQEDILSKKTFIFDIDTVKAREILGPSYTKIYKMIEDFFCSRNFTHIQGSGYESNYLLTQSQAAFLYKKLLETYPIIEMCMRDIRCESVIAFHNFSNITSKTNLDEFSFETQVYDKSDDFDIEL